MSKLSTPRASGAFLLSLAFCLLLLPLPVAQAVPDKGAYGATVVAGSLLLEQYRRPEYSRAQPEPMQEPRYKIMVIIPVVTTAYNAGIKAEIAPVIAPDFQVDYVNLDKGTDFIESRYDEYRDLDAIVQLALQAQSQGYDAIFITCFGEPGVSIVRELVDVPVVGGFLASAATANLLSARYSVITVLDSVLAMIRGLARDLGVEENLVSNQQIGVPVPDLVNHDLVEKALVVQSTRAVDTFGARAIVLGCTGMVGVKEYVQNIINQGKAMPDLVPIVSPNQQSIAYLQNMVRTGMTHSRLTYFKQQPKQPAHSAY